MTENPYQINSADFANPSHFEVGLFRKGSYLVLHKKAVFPDRCIKSNEPTTLRLNRVLYWHSPWIYLIIFVNVLIFVIVAMLIRKKAQFQVPLANRFIQRRRNNIRIAWGLAFAGVTAFFCSPLLQPNQIILLVLLGILLIITAGLWGIYGCRVIYPKYIDDHYVTIAGICPEFLASLPEWAPPFS